MSVPDHSTLVYFSPTRSTRRYVEAIARGWGLTVGRRLDLTRPATRWRPLGIDAPGPVLLGSPAYMGVVPAPVLETLRHMRGRGQAAVVVGVFGHIDHGNVVQRLHESLSQAGFEVVGAASLPAEHSFSTDAYPMAAGRPDDADLAAAEAFGARMRDKLADAGTPAAARIAAPRKLQNDLDRMVGSLTERLGLSRRAHAMRFVSAPQVDRARCVGCQVCEKACPVAAIPRGGQETHAPTCLRCMACVKACPEQARRAPVLPIGRFLRRALFDPALKRRKEPRFFG